MEKKKREAREAYILQLMEAEKNPGMVVEKPKVEVEPPKMEPVVDKKKEEEKKAREEKELQEKLENEKVIDTNIFILFYIIAYFASIY